MWWAARRCLAPFATRSRTIFTRGPPRRKASSGVESGSSSFGLAPADPRGAQAVQHHEAAAFVVGHPGARGLVEHRDGGGLDEARERPGVDVAAQRAVGDSTLDRREQFLRAPARALRRRAPGAGRARRAGRRRARARPRPRGWRRRGRSRRVHPDGSRVSRDDPMRAAPRVKVSTSRSSRVAKWP